MAEKKARLVLSNEVYRQIEWFTYNFDKEIGALGAGCIKGPKDDRYYYVEKLYFPKQKVTCATVDVDKDGYKELITETDFVARSADICFYWHRHPGSAAHSNTDEEHTFGALFSREQKTGKWFGFLQTAKKHDGKMDMEVRIDLKQPVAVTLTDANILVTYEMSEEEAKLQALINKARADIKTTCEQVIEKCILKEPEPIKAQPSNWYGWSDKWNRDYNKTYDYATPTTKDESPELKKLMALINIKRKGNEVIEMNNNLLNNRLVLLKDKAVITMDSGMVTISSGNTFVNLVDKAIANEGYLFSCVSHDKRIKAYDETKISLYPIKGKFEELKERMIKMFLKYNEALVSRETNIINSTSALDLPTSSLTICGDSDKIYSLWADIATQYYVDWQGPEDDYSFGAVMDYEGEHIGWFKTNKDSTEMTVTGEKLIEYIKDINAVNGNDKDEVIKSVAVKPK